MSRQTNIEATVNANSHFIYYVSYSFDLLRTFREEFPYRTVFRRVDNNSDDW